MRCYILSEPLTMTNDALFGSAQILASAAGRFSSAESLKPQSLCVASYVRKAFSLTRIYQNGQAECVCLIRMSVWR